MQGSQRVLGVLNKLLADELSAINQYMVHSEMFLNWGYKDLGAYAKNRARKEMLHAEALIERIIFLEGLPVVSTAPVVEIGSNVKSMFEVDLMAERRAVAGYNDGVAVSTAELDAATRDMLGSHLADEEEHVNYLESQLAAISQMGISAYLSAKASV